MSRFINNPVLISVKTRDSLDSIEQNIVEVGGKNKVDALFEILEKGRGQKTLIFMRTKRNADSLSRTLHSKGRFKSVVMHGNKSQNQRQRSLSQFKDGFVNILIATDVASRGIDVEDIAQVINFDLPETYEDYIHRIGRTGRAGKTGVAFSFVR